VPVFSGDAVIASAMIDRLLRHSDVISIRGESYAHRRNAKPASSPRREPQALA
jgi:hypothetical protein